MARSARLGHASIQMTADRYGHLFPRGDDGAELAAAKRYSWKLNELERQARITASKRRCTSGSVNL